MFSIKVEVNEESREGAFPSANVDANANGEEMDHSRDALDFSVGNQRVEHITGVIHLYKRTESEEETKAVSSQVCVLSVPADVGVQEFSRLCGPHLKSIREMRFLRRENTRKSTYMVWMQFHDENLAGSFVEEHNGRPFCAFEEEVVWKLLYVDRLEYSRDPGPSPGETELPTCPVCLERLDESVSGVVVTVCNHVFHNECLMKWGDTSCPVCRYYMQAPSRTSCNNCGVTEDLWICLICGHVGCGRYKSKHAIDHWKETHHCYALEVESQRVWDYVGDGYVHRLVQTKSCKGLVEVPAPAECSGSRSDSHSAGVNEKVDYDRDEAIVASKIDAVAFEYNHLLSAQLESQRLYFEGIMLQSRVDSDAQTATLQEQMDEVSRNLARARDEAKEATKQKKASAKKASEFAEKARKVEEEKEFLRQLNDTLISNQKQWKEKTEKLEATIAATSAAKDAKILELEEQVRDLIVFIEAQKTVEGGELEGGTVVAAEPERRRETRPSRSRRSRR